jgi:acetyl-CoA/propionyl-CoA carboxylase carboxyl transferase subunit
MSALTVATLDVGTYAPAAASSRDPAARICALVDPGTCELLTAPDSSGMLAATGLVQGQRVVAFASDPAVQGGAMSLGGCQAVLAAYERALAEQCPVIGLWHSGGARLGEGVVSLHGVGQVFAAMTKASGVIPQISVVLGAAAGGAAYGPALTDVVVLAPEGRIFVTGPDVVRSATGEEVDAASLGGADAHGKRSGVAHLVAASEEDAYYLAGRLATLMSDHRAIDLTAVEDRDLGAVLPASRARAYDVRPLVTALLDRKGVELQAGWARNIVTTLGRLGGRTIGVIATNPLRLGGCLDSLSAEKAARFVRMCDAFGIPLVVVVDVPGYLPGTAQEWGGVVRRGAKLLHAFADAVVPRVTLVTRKAYGGAYIAMNSRALGATTVFAWPSAEVAVMSPVSAIRILHRRKLADVPAESRSTVEQELAAEHARTVGGLDRALATGVVDEVIEPSVTRSRIAAALAAALAQAPDGRGAPRGRHTNIPL